MQIIQVEIDRKHESYLQKLVEIEIESVDSFPRSAATQQRV